ncbi:hypothetical protein HYQ44_001137 [Verticillium longisporum]|nr:hypothetical protein HYQ44_001137 [Verticillium longisporum]
MQAISILVFEILNGPLALGSQIGDTSLAPTLMKFANLTTATNRLVVHPELLKVYLPPSGRLPTPFASSFTLSRSGTRLKLQTRLV